MSETSKVVDLFQRWVSLGKSDLELEQGILKELRRLNLKLFDRIMPDLEFITTFCTKLQESIYSIDEKYKEILFVCWYETIMPIKRFKKRGAFHGSPLCSVEILKTMRLADLYESDGSSENNYLFCYEFYIKSHNPHIPALASFRIECDNVQTCQDCSITFHKYYEFDTQKHIDTVKAQDGTYIDYLLNNMDKIAANIMDTNKLRQRSSIF
jgi:hypothetical protein